MSFEGGTFLGLLGIAILFFFIKTPYREGFLMLSCAIFLTLGFLLYSDNDISFVIQSSKILTENNGSMITNTITENTNQTFIMIGDYTNNYNVNSKILAVFLVITGIITGLISFVMFTRTDPPNMTE